MSEAIGNELIATPGLATRFWSKVQKTDGCWLWAGKRDRHGYGRLYLGGGRAHSHEGFAHRVSYAIHFGPIPSDRATLHRCDNPPCVNPAHLFLGTQADNMRDMIAKGREHHRPRITVCAQGHEMTPENRVDTKRRRRCVTCARRMWRESMQRRRQRDPDTVRRMKRESAQRVRERKKSAAITHGNPSSAGLDLRC